MSYTDVATCGSSFALLQVIVLVRTDRNFRPPFSLCAGVTNLFNNPKPDVQINLDLTGNLGRNVTQS